MFFVPFSTMPEHLKNIYGQPTSYPSLPKKFVAKGVYQTMKRSPCLAVVYFTNYFVHFTDCDLAVVSLAQHLTRKQLKTYMLTKLLRYNATKNLSKFNSCVIHICLAWTGRHVCSVCKFLLALEEHRNSQCNKKPLSPVL
jgi:hypothetical protein